MIFTLFVCTFSVKARTFSKAFFFIILIYHMSVGVLVGVGAVGIVGFHERGLELRPVL
jgi:hypothetical protein